MDIETSAKTDQAVHIENAAKAEPPQLSSAWKELVANPKIIGLSLFANLGALMYGFDNMALSLCLSMEAFEMQFGDQTATGYVIPAYWQSLWNSMSQLACMFGAWGIGHISDTYGRRLCFFLSGIVSTAGIAVLYISATSPVFMAGKIVIGFAMGMALATGQSYISEIAPLRLRGILLSAYSFCMNLGLMIAASISFTRLDILTPSAYQVLFAIGWAFSSSLLLFSYLIPESPHFYVRNGKREAALRVLERISNKETAVPALMADMIRVHEHEEQLAGDSKSHSFLECFKGKNWRRTRIILYCNSISQMIGATFLSNGPYFLVNAGMSSSQTGEIVEIGLAFAIASSVITWYFLGRVGRRKIILGGIALACVFFLTMGIASCFPGSKALWAIGITLELTWWTMGPATGPSMAIAGEVSQARLRAESQSIGFAFNYFFSCVWNVVVPYMFNTDEGDLGGKMGWIFLATSLISFVIVYLEFPETKDRTYEELDELFERGISARHFEDH